MLIPIIPVSKEQPVIVISVLIRQLQSEDGFTSAIIEA
jgi:hypothetical protein